MSAEIRLLEKKRFVSLLDIARREGELLLKTDGRLFTSTINANWVRQLEYDDDLAERLDAFVSRFGRMQDTLGDKLLPSLLRLLAEKTGSALDNLNKAEKLGLLTSVMQWLDVRNLRNKLIHEYMHDAEEFALALNQAHTRVALLVTTYNAINQFAQSRIESAAWPQILNSKLQWTPDLGR